jgi:hypothetical protein
VRESIFEFRSEEAPQEYLLVEANNDGGALIKVRSLGGGLASIDVPVTSLPTWGGNCSHEPQHLFSTQPEPPPCGGRSGPKRASENWVRALCSRRSSQMARPHLRGQIVAAVTGFAAGQMKGQRQAVEIDLQVDFGREAAARAAERLIVLPPFAPAAETCARTTVESNIVTRCAVSLIAASASKKASKVPDRLNRQNRFHTLFQCPNVSGRARQVML